MHEQELISLGSMVQELNALRHKYGWWLQGIEVYSPEHADPIAKITTGGADYCVQLLHYPSLKDT